jgi:hypothetical protein
MHAIAIKWHHDGSVDVITGVADDMPTHLVGVGLCPVHASAPALLDALRRIVSTCTDIDNGFDAVDLARWVKSIATDAITKAKGRA